VIKNKKKRKKRKRRKRKRRRWWRKGLNQRVRKIKMRGRRG